LLTPTVLYSPVISQLVEKFKIKGIAHITGGGLYENVPRIIPDNLCAVVQKDNIPKQALFEHLKVQGNIEEKEMYGTFNMGVGLVIVINKTDVDGVLESLQHFSHSSFLLGEISTSSALKIIIQ